MGYSFSDVPQETLGVRLTPLTAQALPELLPLGWSPLAAADVTLELEGTIPVPLSQSAAFAAGAVHLTLPLPAKKDFFDGSMWYVGIGSMSEE